MDARERGGGPALGSDLDARLLAVTSQRRNARKPRDALDDGHVRLCQGRAAVHEEVRRAARRAKGSRPATLVHVVETDGRPFHATGRACERDRRRDRWLKLAGFEPIRFTWREVVEEPAMVLGAVRDLLARLARP